MLDCAKIRKLRIALKISQAQAAKLAGFTCRQTWQHIENGRNGNITLDTLYGIARAVKSDPRKLLKVKTGR